MNETPSESVDSRESLKTICQEVQGLYPRIGKIQSLCSAGKHVSFWVMSDDAPFEEEDFLEVQQAIIARFREAMPEYRCSLNSILQARTSDILSQNRVGTIYMDEVCRAVEAEFARDEIHVVYENGEFVVYGMSSPLGQPKVQAAITDKIPNTLHQCGVEFRSLTEWEDNQNVTDAVQRARATFAGVGVPSKSGLFSNLGLLLGCLSDWFESERGPK